MNPLIALQGNAGFNPLAIDAQITDSEYKRASINALMAQERARSLEYKKQEAAQQEAQRQQAGYNALLARIPQDADLNQRANLLIKGGYQKQGLDLLEGASKAGELGARTRKQDTESSKMTLEQALKAQEYIGQTAGALLNDPMLDANKVAQSFRNGVGMGILPVDIANQRIAQLQTLQSPQQVREFVSMMHNAAKSLQQQADERKQTPLTINNGNKHTIVSFNPQTGKSEVSGQMAISQSPDNAANNARAGSEGAANRDVTMRGQDIGAAGTLMSEGRLRDESMRKAGEEKPLTEGQAKALAFSSRMQASLKTIDELHTKGVDKTIPGAGGNGIVGKAVNAVSSTDRQKLTQAKRDFVNATLRRESGAVISDQEFANAEMQYFPQVGDKPAVIAQKAENRRIALEGIKEDVPAAKRGRVDQIASPASKTIVRTGTINGRKVAEYSDGTTAYIK